jgi:ribosomal protein L21E
MSKAKAKVGTTNDRVAKFMGDFMQALTMVAHIKHNTVAKYNYCLATGDAMLCNSFIFMCSIAKVSPNLWMPISKQQTSLVYGNMLNNFNPNSNIKSAPTEVRNANKVRRTPNRSNGARSNGSGYAKPISLTSISAGSLAGSTVASNNNGNNEIQSPNRGRTNLNKQLRAKGLNNNTVNTLLKNYNKGMNVNNVINKANTIVLNKKKAENKKNLNQRLRNKGLNNNTVNTLLKNYNTGKLNFNGAIAKANTIVLNKKKAENKKNLNQRLRNKGLNNNTRIALLNKYNKGTLNVNGVIAKANQIINNKRSNPAEMNLGAAIMSGEGMKRPRNSANYEAQIANLQAQLARAQAAQNAAEKAKNAAARNARNARNASNAQAAKNAREKNAAANNAAKEANAKAKRLARALKQIQTNASLAGVSPNQGLRKSKRQR